MGNNSSPVGDLFNIHELKKEFNLLSVVGIFSIKDKW